ncbi:MAG: CAP domain-containing protein [Desulfovibrionales bacterium]
MQSNLLIIVLWCLWLFPADRVEAGTPQPSPEEQELVSLINTKRAEQGLNELSCNLLLHRAARDHAETMAEQDYLGHESPDGTGFQERIYAAGYPKTRVGEAVGAGWKDAQEALQNFMESPTHREILMGPKFTEIGVGYALSPDTLYEHYWTVDVGAGGAPQIR